MFFKSTLTLTTLLSLITAQMTPTSPDSTTVARIGSELTTMWAKDTTGVWTDVTIQLMTGDNFNMIPVTTLTSNIDSTTLTSYTFQVPSVTPTSAIYFLQFTPGTGNLSDVTWTTRFTIAAADGSTTSPANSLQPNGASIPWGVGALTNPSAANSTDTNTAAAGGGGSAIMQSSASAAASASAAKTTPAAATTPAVVVVPAPKASSSTETVSESQSGSGTALAAAESAAASGSGTASGSSSRTAAAAAATSTGAAVKGLKSGLGGVLGAVLVGVVML